MLLLVLIPRPFLRLGILIQNARDVVAFAEMRYRMPVI